MSINGIGTAAYLAAGHRAGRAESNTASGTKGFLETVAEKTAQDKEAEWNEKAFDLAGAKAPQSVKDAWMETVKEVGVNGLGMTSNGMTHITELHMQQIIANYWGYSINILGDSVQSAMRAAQKALYDFDHPLESGKVRSMEEQQARVKERQFYVTFLEKLGKLSGAGEVGTDTVSGTNFKGIILNWKPSGAEPAMSDLKVQARIRSTIGRKSIIVPPALEAKMKNDPKLAQRVMARVEDFIARNDAEKIHREEYYQNPCKGYLIALDEK